MQNMQCMETGLKFGAVAFILASDGKGYLLRTLRAFVW
jgi:hypothetical protein